MSRATQAEWSRRKRAAAKLDLIREMQKAAQRVENQLIRKGRCLYCVWRCPDRPCTLPKEICRYWRG